MMSWTTTGLEPAMTRFDRPIDPEVMHVLSASMYNEVAPHSPNPHRNREIPMGLVMEDSNAEDEESSRPRKRTRPSKASHSKPSDGSDDGSKKHRGRPRIEGQDETAVDRRRTQIRLAQRAYRNRKETTIATLKQQNADLQASIGRLNDAFSKVYQEISKSDMMRSFPETRRDLDILRQELDHAVTLSTTDDQSENDQANTAASAKAPKPTDPGVSKKAGSRRVSSPPKSQPPTAQQTTVNEETILEHRSKPTDLSYGGMPPIDLISNFGAGGATYFDWNADAMTHIASQAQNVATTATMEPWSPPNLSLERSFPNRRTYTYSFQETTFARRLQRMCLERSFRTLTDPNSDPHTLNRTFRFTFFFVNRNKLRGLLQAILQRKAGEPLENESSPFFHIGGAGTHFPRRDAVGKPIFPPNLQSPVKAPGPWQLIDSGNKAHDNELVQNMLEEMGYGGEWFDAHDVEQYLRSKGIYLDGTSSFVEVDTAKFSYPAAEYRASSAHSSSVPTLATSPASSHSHSLPNEVPPSALGDQPNLRADVNAKDPLNFMHPMGGHDFTSPFQWPAPSMENALGSLPSPESMASLDPMVSRKHGMLAFDVEKFLDRVTDAGACLGRAPGYPKEAVDHAVAVAIQEAF